MNRNMTHTFDSVTIRRWMLASLLLLGMFAAIPQARAQMSGTFSTDIVIIESAMSATMTAAGNNDVAGTRVNMEELYRQWRQFRQKNIDARPKDPQFAPNMLKAEESLFAASKLVDQEKTAAARSELENAQTLIRNLRPQAEAK
jgi:hypothetical protein